MRKKIHEGIIPYNRLCDPRWMDVALARLKELDEVIERRQRLRSMRSTIDEDEKARKTAEAAKAKEARAKAKAEAAGKGKGKD